LHSLKSSSRRKLVTIARAMEPRKEMLPMPSKLANASRASTAVSTLSDAPENRVQRQQTLQPWEEEGSEYLYFAVPPPPPGILQLVSLVNPSNKFNDGDMREDA
jgi:hypothetical protein